MALESLTALVCSSPPPIDAVAWRCALDRATATLADLAVRRPGAGPFRITDHEIRTALADPAGRRAPDEPFAWSARTARRSIGLGAIRLLAAGSARAPVEAVQARIDESARWVAEGAAGVSSLDRWLAGLAPAGRTEVAAASTTWATRLWCALDWASLPVAPAIGRDHWWDSPHSALLALRGRADVRCGPAALVVLSGPRRDSVRAELALVTLVEALRARGRGTPGRVVGWWPDSGRTVTLDPGAAVLTSAVEAVGAVLGAGMLQPRRAA
jgi:hypothetical protein